MQVDGLELILKWSRSRRTIGLTVTTEGKLVVSAPRGTSRESIAQALEKHRPWIEGKIAERKEAWRRLPAGAVFFLGQPYPLKVTPGAPASVNLELGGVRLRLPGEIAGLWPLLQDWYQREAESLIRARVDHYAARLDVAVGQLEVRHWQRRWGECRPHQGGILRFNWRLILLPPEVLDYVVVHELVHLKVSGHNSRFWRQVVQVLPDYAARRRWLNRWGAPFLLWQPEV